MAAEVSTIQTACECQAMLFATLDGQRLVTKGWAVRGTTECSPAHSISPKSERFDVGWQCPFCGRNVMRTFYASALRPVAVTSG